MVSHPIQETGEIPNDEALMLRYQDGDYCAFEELFRRHSPRVYGYLRKKVGTEEAKDVMQATFLKLHRNRSRYQSAYPFLPWLFTIARNLLTDFYRQQKTVATEEKQMERLLSSAQTEVSEEDPSGLMERVLGDLPHHQQELLRLRFNQGLSFDEMATQLGLQPVTLRKRVSRLLNNLKKKGD